MGVFTNYLGALRFEITAREIRHRLLLFVFDALKPLIEICLGAEELFQILLDEFDPALH